VGFDVHNLPSWNRVTSVQNLPAIAARRAAVRFFFGGCPSVRAVIADPRSAAGHARITDNSWRPPKLLESAGRSRIRSAWSKSAQADDGLAVQKILPRTQTLPTRQQLEELLQSDPDDVFLQYAVAKARISEGDVEGGLAQFQVVIDGNPDYVPAYFQKGQSLAERGRIEEARTVLTNGIQIARKVGDGHAEREMTEYLESL
jgi:thioredoxin-like negative regulator of GroEL